MGQTAVQFQERQQFLLGLAQAANVPIVPVALDYGRKLIEIGVPLWPEMGETAVLAQLCTFYADAHGKRLALFSLDSIRP
jgi:1-acyl-sn-glycerol-3-phosphate acyltransferase